MRSLICLRIADFYAVRLLFQRNKKSKTNKFDCGRVQRFLIMHFSFFLPLLMLLIKLHPLALLESVFRQVKKLICLFYFVLFFIPPNPPLQLCVVCSGEAM